MPPVRPATGQTPCALIQRQTDASTTDGADHACPAFAGHLKLTLSADDQPSAERVSDTRESFTPDPAIDPALHAALDAALVRFLGQRNVDHWFRERTTLTIDGDTLVVGVGSPFLAQWMQRQFRSGLLSAVRTVLGPAASLSIQADPRVEMARGEGSTARNASAARTATVPARESDSFALRDRRGPSPLASVLRVPEQSVRPIRTERVSSPLSTRESIVAFAGPADAQSCAIEPPTESNAPHRDPSEKAAAPDAKPPSTTRSSQPDASAARAARRLADLSELVSGSCNELALAAARQVCETPGQRVNPLFLHGLVGTGKTAVLEGIARRLRRSFPNSQVMLLSAEGFANLFTEALRDRTLPSFRQRFRTVDVLLIDDVDFLDGKKVIQEEFLHTVKQLECLGRQIVVTADRHPRLFQKSSDDLVTRLLSGLVCRLEKPDLETRRRIVAAKAAQSDAEFSPEALTYVAQRFANGVRELEGALHSLSVWHSVTRKRVTVAAARSVLSDLERDCVRIVRTSDVEEKVCEFFGVTADELKSSSRARTVSTPRMLAMFLARKLTRAAYSEIGQHFGGRNHSTVMSAERKVQEWIDQGTTLRIASREWRPQDLVEALEQQLQAS